MAGEILAYASFISSICLDVVVVDRMCSSLRFGFFNELNAAVFESGYLVVFTTSCWDDEMKTYQSQDVDSSHCYIRSSTSRTSLNLYCYRSMRAQSCMKDVCQAVSLILTPQVVESRKRFVSGVEICDIWTMGSSDTTIGI